MATRDRRGALLRELAATEMLRASCPENRAAVHATVDPTRPMVAAASDCGTAERPTSRCVVANLSARVDSLAQMPRAVATAATIRPSPSVRIRPRVAPASPPTSVLAGPNAPFGARLTASAELQQASDGGLEPVTSSSDGPS